MKKFCKSLLSAVLVVIITNLLVNVNIFLYNYPCYASVSWTSKKARLSFKRYDGPFMDITEE